MKKCPPAAETQISSNFSGGSEMGAVEFSAAPDCLSDDGKRSSGVQIVRRAGPVYLVCS